MDCNHGMENTYGTVEDLEFVIDRKIRCTVMGSFDILVEISTLSSLS